MNLSDYQVKAMQFAKYKTPDYPFAAISEEVGEVIGKLSKYSRKNGCTIATAVDDSISGVGDAGKSLREDLKKELGDVLWQLQACCTEAGFTLTEVAELNLQKLGDRSDRGVIIGEGDDR